MSRTGHERLSDQMIFGSKGLWFREFLGIEVRSHELIGGGELQAFYTDNFQKFSLIGIYILYVYIFTPIEFVLACLRADITGAMSKVILK